MKSDTDPFQSGAVLEMRNDEATIEMPSTDQRGARELEFMVRLLIRAVQVLGDVGQAEFACRIAAAAWVALYDVRPEEVEKLNSTIRSLTRLNPKEQKEALISDTAAT